MDLDLAGKCAVVTGGSRGIGRAIALSLAAEGVNVAICARHEPPLRATEREIASFGVVAHAVSCDVADSAALKTFLDDARQSLGAVDIFIHNASALAMGDTAQDWDASLSVDLMAAVHGCRRVIPWMVEAGGGNICFISSGSGLESWGSLPAYSSAKAAMMSYSKNLAVSLARHRIRVNTVAPGAIEFEGGVWNRIKEEKPKVYEGMIRSIPWGRAGTPKEVADVVTFLVSNRASWVTGACLNVDGAQYKGNH